MDPHPASGKTAGRSSCSTGGELEGQHRRRNRHQVAQPEGNVAVLAERVELAQVAVQRLEMDPWVEAMHGPAREPMPPAFAVGVEDFGKRCERQ